MTAQDEDGDVAAERKRVMRGSGRHDLIRLENITKVRDEHMEGLEGGHHNKPVLSLFQIVGCRSKKLLFWPPHKCYIALKISGASTRNQSLWQTVIFDWSCWAIIWPSCFRNNSLELIWFWLKSMIALWYRGLQRSIPKGQIKLFVKAKYPKY